MNRLPLLAGSALALTLAACGPAEVATPEATTSEALTCDGPIQVEGPCAIETTDLSMIDLQAVGSHNSYKIAIPENELAMIAMTSEEWAKALDYGHVPLAEQLDLGMRQLEIDVARDPEGGLYADPMLPRAFADQPDSVPYDATGMDAPGFKVLHVQDIDPRSYCNTFVLCLQQINDWSLAHPEHAPLLILINLKAGTIDVPGTVEAPAFDAASFDALDAEVRSVLGADRLITPDDVRGDAASLREAVLAGGWPKLDAARGKILFAIDSGAANVELYLRGQRSLEGHVMFVNAISEDADHAAYFTMNNPLEQGALIKDRVAKGFLVRTRADANTIEARENDTTKRDAAYASGAQYISTDYYLPRTEWSDFTVRLPGGAAAVCNPVREACAE